MAMVSVLEPSVLHITTDDWYDPTLAARFEQRWIDLADSLKNAMEVGAEHRAVWSRAVEALVSNHETAPAWMIDRAARQRLMPSFYRSLWPLLDSVDAPEASAVSTQPPLDDRSPDDPWLRATLGLLAWAVGQPADLAIQSGVKGTDEAQAEVVDRGIAVKHALICHDRAEFLRLLPLRELFGTATKGQLPALVELGVQLFLFDHPERERVYALDFADGFLVQMEAAPRALKAHIVDAIVGRATQTQKAAQADKGLKDEPLGGRDGWRRLRVTRDWRIHYSYPTARAIRLETVGPHDLGLRRTPALHLP